MYIQRPSSERILQTVLPCLGYLKRLLVIRGIAFSVPTNPLRTFPRQITLSLSHDLLSLAHLSLRALSLSAKGFR